RSLQLITTRARAQHSTRGRADDGVTLGVSDWLRRLCRIRTSRRSRRATRAPRARSRRIRRRIRRTSNGLNLLRLAVRHVWILIGVRVTVGIRVPLLHRRHELLRLIRLRLRRQRQVVLQRVVGAIGTPASTRTDTDENRRDRQKQPLSLGNHWSPPSFPRDPLVIRPPIPS